MGPIETLEGKGFGQGNGDHSYPTQSERKSSRIDRPSLRQRVREARVQCIACATRDIAVDPSSCACDLDGEKRAPGRVSEMCRM